MEKVYGEEISVNAEEPEKETGQKGGDVTVPRKRGRPPMNAKEAEKSAGGDIDDSESENAKPNAAGSPSPRKRGPRNISDDTPTSPPGQKRGRGRPRKYPPGSRPPARAQSGRPRGRPRKNPLDSKDQTADGTPVVKKPRGRPPKKSIETDGSAQSGAARSPLKVALKGVSLKLTKPDGNASDGEKPSRGRPPKKKAAPDDGVEEVPKKRGRPAKAKAKALAPAEESAEESSE